MLLREPSARRGPSNVFGGLGPPPLGRDTEPTPLPFQPQNPLPKASSLKLRPIGAGGFVFPADPSQKTYIYSIKQMPSKNQPPEPIFFKIFSTEEHETKRGCDFTSGTRFAQEQKKRPGERFSPSKA